MPEAGSIGGSLMEEQERRLTHLDHEGRARMVDISQKLESVREAVARGRVKVAAETLELLRETALPKGDVLTVTQVAGIMAAKKTAELIPMCHPIRFQGSTSASGSVTIPRRWRSKRKCAPKRRPVWRWRRSLRSRPRRLPCTTCVSRLQRDMLIDESPPRLQVGGRRGEYRALGKTNPDETTAKNRLFSRGRLSYYKGMGLALKLWGVLTAPGDAPGCRIIFEPREGSHCHCTERERRMTLKPLGDRVVVQADRAGGEDPKRHLPTRHGQGEAARRAKVVAVGQRPCHSKR